MTQVDRLGDAGRAWKNSWLKTCEFSERKSFIQPLLRQVVAWMESEIPSQMTSQIGITKDHAQIARSTILKEAKGWLLPFYRCTIKAKKHRPWLHRACWELPSLNCHQRFMGRVFWVQWESYFELRTALKCRPEAKVFSLADLTNWQAAFREQCT